MSEVSTSDRFGNTDFLESVEDPKERQNSDDDKTPTADESKIGPNEDRKELDGTTQQPDPTTDSRSLQSGVEKEKMTKEEKPSDICEDLNKSQTSSADVKKNKQKTEKQASHVKENKFDPKTVYVKDINGNYDYSKFARKQHPYQRMNNLANGGKANEAKNSNLKKQQNIKPHQFNAQKTSKGHSNNSKFYDSRKLDGKQKKQLKTANAPGIEGKVPSEIITNPDQSKATGKQCECENLDSGRDQKFVLGDNWEAAFFEPVEEPKKEIREMEMSGNQSKPEEVDTIEDEKPLSLEESVISDKSKAPPADNNKITEKQKLNQVASLKIKPGKTGIEKPRSAKLNRNKSKLSQQQMINHDLEKIEKKLDRDTIGLSSLADIEPKTESMTEKSLQEDSQQIKTAKPRKNIGSDPGAKIFTKKQEEKERMVLIHTEKTGTQVSETQGTTKKEQIEDTSFENRQNNNSSIDESKSKTEKTKKTDDLSVENIEDELLSSKSYEPLKDPKTNRKVANRIQANEKKPVLAVKKSTMNGKNVKSKKDKSTGKIKELDFKEVKKSKLLNEGEIEGGNNKDINEGADEALREDEKKGEDNSDLEGDPNDNPNLASTNGDTRQQTAKTETLNGQSIDDLIETVREKTNGSAVALTRDQSIVIGQKPTGESERKQSRGIPDMARQVYGGFHNYQPPPESDENEDEGSQLNGSNESEVSKQREIKRDKKRLNKKGLSKGVPQSSRYVDTRYVQDVSKIRLDGEKNGDEKQNETEKTNVDDEKETDSTKDEEETGKKEQEKPKVDEFGRPIRTKSAILRAKEVIDKKDLTKSTENLLKALCEDAIEELLKNAEAEKDSESQSGRGSPADTIDLVANENKHDEDKIKRLRQKKKQEEYIPKRFTFATFRNCPCSLCTRKKPKKMKYLTNKSKQKTNKADSIKEELETGGNESENGEQPQPTLAEVAAEQLLQSSEAHNINGQEPIETNASGMVVQRIIEMSASLPMSQLLWRITDVKNKIKAARNEQTLTIYSQHFYTAPHGYKMQVATCPYGGRGKQCK